MALADSVPGVSGGTIAFLLGFYDKFIGSLDALMSGNMQQKKRGGHFSAEAGNRLDRRLPDGGICARQHLSYTDLCHILYCLMGFILFAIPIVIREERKT